MTPGRKLGPGMAGISFTSMVELRHYYSLNPSTNSEPISGVEGFVLSLGGARLAVCDGFGVPSSYALTALALCRTYLAARTDLAAQLALYLASPTRLREFAFLEYLSGELPEEFKGVEEVVVGNVVQPCPISTMPFENCVRQELCRKASHKNGRSPRREKKTEGEEEELPEFFFSSSVLEDVDHGDEVAAVVSPEEATAVQRLSWQSFVERAEFASDPGDGDVDSDPGAPLPVTSAREQLSSAPGPQTLSPVIMQLLRYLEIRARLDEYGNDHGLRDGLLCNVFDFSVSAPGASLFAVIPSSLKRSFTFRHLDAGYMSSKVAKRNFVEDSEARSKLVEFIRHPDPEEPGYKADCWSIEHDDPRAAGQPKDGATVLSFDGNIYCSAAHLCHMPQTFSIAGGTRHSAALGFAEWLVENQKAGAVFIKSDAGSVKILLPHKVSNGEVWELADPHQ